MKSIMRICLLSIALSLLSALAFLVEPTWGRLDMILEPVAAIGFLDTYFAWAITLGDPKMRVEIRVTAILPE